jgi:hypothetical protein
MYLHPKQLTLSLLFRILLFRACVLCVKDDANLHQLTKGNLFTVNKTSAIPGIYT